MAPAFVIGDIHGHPDALARLLRESGLADAGLAWSGADARLYLIGDLVGHGPDGVGVLDALMRLQAEAARAGGAIVALLGNHDAMLIAAARLGDAPAGDGRSLRDEWRASGGQERDLARLGRQHIAWMLRLPAAVREGEHLLIHADSAAYRDYGDRADVVCAGFELLMRGDEPGSWRRVLDALGEHRAFWGEGGAERAAELLRRLGGRQIVHGHTPIAKLTGERDAAVTGPLSYADGRCLNVDGGIYRGGPGFVHRLS